jgi:AraC family transcriptional regulator, regulatory protein of adaptative response / methylated-DNA-[protein]-cysteine methyltransferase
MRRDEIATYEAMRDAILYLREHAHEQPDLAAVARVVGMSPSRFTHVFTDWVGTTPKRYLGYLTKLRARELLSQSHDIVRTAYQAGLSGPGRLHDLLVAHDGLTPGELKSRDFTIFYGVHQTPFGWCLLGVTERGICQLTFLEENQDRRARELLQTSWPGAHFQHDLVRTTPVIEKIFSGAQASFPLLVRGTNFQIKVWEALLAIPEGAVTDYATIASLIGNPRAVRAVGSACGKNPLAYLIPCHRVLASDGGLGGYRWDIARKEAMLVRELDQDSLHLSTSLDL